MIVLGVTGTRPPRGGFTNDELRSIESQFQDAVAAARLGDPDVRLVQGGCLGVDEYLAWIAKDLAVQVITVLSDDRSQTAPNVAAFTDSLVEAHVPRPSDRNPIIVQAATAMYAWPLYAERSQPYSGTWHCVRLAIKAAKLAPKDLHVLRPERR